MGKGQMEVIGILVIIVLLILGLLFFVRFADFDDDGTELVKRVRNKEVASNLIDSILNSESTCLQLDLEELVKDCAKYYNDGQCPGGGRKQCPDSLNSFQNLCSCPYVERTFEDIFELTLDAWQIPYSFIAVNGDNELFSLGSACPRGSDASTFVIPGNVATIMTLHICE